MTDQIRPAVARDKIPNFASAGDVTVLWIYRLLLLGLAALIIGILARHPVATNDGPVHVEFSNLIDTLQQPKHELQRLAYMVKLRPSPNLMIYLLMTVLLRVFSAGMAESIIQILCIIGPVAAGYFALRMVNPRNAWLSVFILPLSFNQMFFYGLYNHCISTAAFFLAVGAYYWMAENPSAWRALTVSGALVLTFICHASGFVMAMAGIGAMTGTKLALSLARGEGLAKALSKQRHALVAMLVPLPLPALFLLSGGGGSISFGPGIRLRLSQFLLLKLLDVNSRPDAFVAIATSVLLLVASGCVAISVLGNRQELGSRRRDDALATIVATAVAVIVMLLFPDSLGGGWTHFRRFVIFPFFWELLILSFGTFSIRVSSMLMAFGTLAALALVGSTVIRQSMIREQMAPLAEVNRLIGSHCTVLPIVLDGGPVEADGKRASIAYSPFYQAASQLELTNDRVVLFNFLARLNVYPVHFQPNVEPQKYVFHWRPQQHETSIETVDIGGFEHVSGMHVDYVLVWGGVNGKTEALREQVHTALASSRAVYRSSDGRVSLYRRPGTEGGRCLSVDSVSVALTRNWPQRTAAAKPRRRITGTLRRRSQKSTVS